MTMAQAAEGSESCPSYKTLHEIERDYVMYVLLRTNGKKSAATRILGISRWALSRRLRKYRADAQSS